MLLAPAKLCGLTQQDSILQPKYTLPRGPESESQWPSVVENAVQSARLSLPYIDDNRRARRRSKGHGGQPREHGAIGTSSRPRTGLSWAGRTGKVCGTSQAGSFRAFALHAVRGAERAGLPVQGGACVRHKVIDPGFPDETSTSHMHLRHAGIFPGCTSPKLNGTSVSSTLAAPRMNSHDHAWKSGSLLRAWPGC